MRVILFLALAASFVIQSSHAEAFTVLGKDTRVRITDQKAISVHESIGLILSRFGDTVGTCTGTVIGPRHVVTAAHCIYNDKDRKITRESYFYPSLRTNYELQKYPHGSFSATKLRIHPRYPHNNSPETDIALITFSENLPVNALPFRVMKKTEQTIKIAGYPTDKTLGQLWEGSGKRFSHLFESNPNSHDVDTFSGQSGSAVRVGNTIVGVHSGSATAILYNYNMAHFFTNDTVNLLKRWMKEDR